LQIPGDVPAINSVARNGGDNIIADGFSRVAVSSIGPQIFTILRKKRIRLLPADGESIVPLECHLCCLGAFVLPHSAYLYLFLSVARAALRARDASLNKSYADRCDARPESRSDALGKFKLAPRETRETRAIRQTTSRWMRTRGDLISSFRSRVQLQEKRSSTER